MKRIIIFLFTGIIIPFIYGQSQNSFIQFDEQQNLNSRSYTSQIVVGVSNLSSSAGLPVEVRLIVPSNYDTDDIRFSISGSSRAGVKSVTTEGQVFTLQFFEDDFEIQSGNQTTIMEVTGVVLPLPYCDQVRSTSVFAEVYFDVDDELVLDVREEQEVTQVIVNKSLNISSQAHNREVFCSQKEIYYEVVFVSFGGNVANGNPSCFRFEFPDEGNGNNPFKVHSIARAEWEDRTWEPLELISNNLATISSYYIIYYEVDWANFPPSHSVWNNNISHKVKVSHLESDCAFGCTVASDEVTIVDDYSGNTCNTNYTDSTDIRINVDEKCPGCSGTDSKVNIVLDNSFVTFDASGETEFEVTFPSNVLINVLTLTNSLAQIADGISYDLWYCNDADYTALNNAYTSSILPTNNLKAIRFKFNNFKGMSAAHLDISFDPLIDKCNVSDLQTDIQCRLRNDADVQFRKRTASIGTVNCIPRVRAREFIAAVPKAAGAENPEYPDFTNETAGLEPGKSYRVLLRVFVDVNIEQPYSNLQLKYQLSNKLEFNKDVGAKVRFSHEGVGGNGLHVEALFEDEQWLIANFDDFDEDFNIYFDENEDNILTIDDINNFYTECVDRPFLDILLEVTVRADAEEGVANSSITGTATTPNPYPFTFLHDRAAISINPAGEAKSDVLFGCSGVDGRANIKVKPGDEFYMLFLLENGRNTAVNNIKMVGTLPYEGDVLFTNTNINRGSDVTISCQHVSPVLFAGSASSGYQQVDESLYDLRFENPDQVDFTCFSDQIISNCDFNSWDDQCGVQKVTFYLDYSANLSAFNNLILAFVTTMPTSAQFGDRVSASFIAEYQEVSNTARYFMPEFEPSTFVEVGLTKVCDPTPSTCENCITSFSPFRGEKYLLTAWVKELGEGQTTFVHPEIELHFPNSSDPSHPAIISGKGSGQIIDGWQRVEEEFVVPNDATLMNISLVNTAVRGSNVSVYFDDIRIHPFNSNMKSFVYDPETFRLMAELDENNYATFYEYDEEGALVRVKKETERGIKTIQESRNNTVKESFR